MPATRFLPARMPGQGMAQAPSPLGFLASHSAFHSHAGQFLSDRALFIALRAKWVTISRRPISAHFAEIERLVMMAPLSTFSR